MIVYKTEPYVGERVCAKRCRSARRATMGRSHRGVRRRRQARGRRSYSSYAEGFEGGSGSENKCVLSSISCRISCIVGTDVGGRQRLRTIRRTIGWAAFSAIPICLRSLRPTRKRPSISPINHSWRRYVVDSFQFERPPTS